MDGGYHEYGFDDDDSSKGSNASPPGHQDISDLMLRFIAVAEVVRDGDWKLGELVARNVRV